MRMVVKLVHPLGFPCEVDLLEEEVRDVDTLLAAMMQRGYRPRTGAWPRGPGGNPLCLKHQVEMPRHSKHDDAWFSHKVVTAKGVEYYCRGYRHGDEANDGFLH